jgi:hypothetical protein
MDKILYKSQYEKLLSNSSVPNHIKSLVRKKTKKIDYVFIGVDFSG